MLNSPLIYRIGKFKLRNVIWLNSTRENGAWIFCGKDMAVIIPHIYDHFFDETLYLVDTRNESKQIDENNVANEIGDILGKHSFSIWDTDFKRVIEFSETGDVMRLGMYPVHV